MNGLLEQLTSRSLDSMPLAVRPRQLSRFESKTQSEIGTDVAAASVFSTIAQDHSWRDDQPVQPIQTMNNAFMAQPRLERRTMPDIAIPPITENRQLDFAQTQAAAPFARPLTEPAPSLGVEPVESISHEETHHHHQHHTEHNYHSQIIEQPNEQTVIVLQPESRVSQDRAAPNIVAEDTPIRKAQTEEQDVTPHIVHPRIESTDQIPQPQVIAKPVVPAPPVEAPQRAERPSSVPRIVVETHVASEPVNHTVTVTIGRIEVRAPQKPAAPAIDNSKRPAARIMSLDDYMRRRAGGAG